MEEYIIIQIERHEANHTSAFTRWILPQNSKFIYSDKTKGRTHWFEYYLVPENSQVVRIRRSNRGNISKTVFNAKDLEASNDMKEILKILKVI
jgi:translation initiation factor 1 (eIF-1/SUI1)